MNRPFLLLAVILFLSCEIFAQSDWEVLKHIRPNTTYRVMDVDANCYTTMRIEVEKNGSLHMLLQNQHEMSLPREKVIRVTEGSFEADEVYTARSSWADVKAVKFYIDEYLKITTKDGKTYKANKSAKVDDDWIAVGKKKIAKSEIASVDYLRGKPVSDWTHYATSESVGWMSGEWWLYTMRLWPKFTMRLYDAGKAEDNSQLECKTRR